MQKASSKVSGRIPIRCLVRCRTKMRRQSSEAIERFESVPASDAIYGSLWLETMTNHFQRLPML